MNKEFHYWITGLIAEHAGFPAEDCRRIAYASQFTDDNNNEVNVYDSEFDVLPSYMSHVSQTEDILRPRDAIMKIYPLFHFIPGDIPAASLRVDAKTHPLLTTPDSSYACRIMEYTLQNAVSRYISGDRRCLYRIGIAIHCYVDTWAHQNFIGWYDDMNGLPGVGFPNIGHFDAMHDPDLVNHTWTDQRLQSSTIVNNDRFIRAAERLFEHLSGFCGSAGLNSAGSWSELRDFLVATWALDEPARIAAYRTRIPVLGEYRDRELELGAFVRRNVVPPGSDGNMVERCVWRSDVQRTETEWFQFQEAVKAHIADAATIVRPALLAAGVHI